MNTGADMERMDGFIDEHRDKGAFSVHICTHQSRKFSKIHIVYILQKNYYLSSASLNKWHFSLKFLLTTSALSLDNY